MNKFLKSFLIALGVSIVIHSVVLIIQLLIKTFNYDEFFDITRLTLPVLVISIFLSFYLYDKNKSFNSLLIKVISINLLSIFFLVYLFFMFFVNTENHSILSFQNFLIAIISSFVSLFFLIYKRINTSKLSSTKTSLKGLDFSYIKLFLIPFSASVFYIVIAAINSFYLIESVKIIYTFLPVGFIYSLISIHYFNYIYGSYNNSKRKFFIAIYYIIGTGMLVFWIIVSYNNFRIVKDGLGASLDRAFLLPAILLYSPFFLYVLIVTQLYFTQLLNKREKQFLEQLSLTNQLNYQQLKNQLSPHFLFNNINVLTGLIEENPKKAIQFSNNLAGIYHYFLEQEQKDVVKVKHEIAFATQYLDLLKERFEESLQFKINVDDSLLEKYIVTTVLQQLLENVIKHNILSKENVITVNITSEENSIKISNNKILKTQLKTYSGKGLENIKKRIAFFTDEKVIIEDLEKSFTVKIPILETV